VIVWLFAERTESLYKIPADLFLPLALAIGALFLDLLQHLFRSIAWHIQVIGHEKKLFQNEITEESDVYVSSSVNFWSYIFYYGKVVILFAAYLMLLLFLIRTLEFSG